jgi:hypothetical protein
MLTKTFLPCLFPYAAAGVELHDAVESVVFYQWPPGPSDPVQEKDQKLFQLPLLLFSMEHSFKSAVPQPTQTKHTHTRTHKHTDTHSGKTSVSALIICIEHGFLGIHLETKP